MKEIRFVNTTLAGGRIRYDVGVSGPNVSLYVSPELCKWFCSDMTPDLALLIAKALRKAARKASA